MKAFYHTVYFVYFNELAGEGLKKRLALWLTLEISLAL